MTPAELKAAEAVVKTHKKLNDDASGIWGLWCVWVVDGAPTKEEGLAACKEIIRRRRALGVAVDGLEAVLKG